MEKNKEKFLKVTYVRSIIGMGTKQGKILEALGFKKLGTTRLLPDNGCIRGSIFKIQHLLQVEEA